MKKLFSCVLAAIMLVCCGCSEKEQRDVSGQSSAVRDVTQSVTTGDDKMYSFSVCDRELLPYGTFRLRGLYDGEKAVKHSLFIGQAIALFGREYMTENNEDLYSATVRAEDGEGGVIYFEVYYGPSCPAIGGDFDESTKEKVLNAADELAEYIMAAKPADFEHQSVYGDLGITIKMGVMDGVPYYDTEIPEGFFGE